LDPNPNPNHIPKPNLNLTDGGCYVMQLPACSFQTVALISGILVKWRLAPLLCLLCMVPSLLVAKSLKKK